MKNRILTKLRSRTGASITFALLLFLVCAVLASVILVAASAAAGRMSGIAEADQRYYAVTSAAELLRDLLEDQDKPASIVWVDSNSNKKRDSNEVYLVEKRASEIKSTADLENLNVNYQRGRSLRGDMAHYIYDLENESLPFPRSLTSDIDGDPLAVTVNGSVEPEPDTGSTRLTLRVTNNVGDPYTLTLTFVLDTQVEFKALLGLPPTTRAEITTYTWKLAGVKT